MLKRLAKYNMNCNYFVSDEKYEEHEEYQYLNLIHDILENGVTEQGRNGVTKSIFGASMIFSLRDGKIPILTTKRTAWKTCFKELLWFISGDTSNEKLHEQGVHIWDGNASREFLDSRGLYTNVEGDLGPVYGHQWRHFNAPYMGCGANYSDTGVDQLQNIIDVLKNADPNVRNSRRLVLSAWNPCQLDEMALPPCHVLMQEHMEALRGQLSRRPYEFAKIEINETNENREKIDNYRIEDIKLVDYKSHETIAMRMIA